MTRCFEYRSKNGGLLAFNFKLALLAAATAFLCVLAMSTALCVAAVRIPTAGFVAVGIPSTAAIWLARRFWSGKKGP